MDEARLIDKLQLIEALYSGATTEGEKVAAERARDRILERLKLWEKADAARENFVLLPTADMGGFRSEGAEPVDRVAVSEAYTIWKSTIVTNFLAVHHVNPGSPD